MLDLSKVRNENRNRIRACKRTKQEGAEGGNSSRHTVRYEGTGERWAETAAGVQADLVERRVRRSKPSIHVGASTTKCEGADR